MKRWGLGAVVAMVAIWGQGCGETSRPHVASSGGGGGQGGSAVCPEGSESCACRDDDTCNAGLVCSSNLCVAPTGEAGSGGSSVNSTGASTGGNGGSDAGGAVGSGGSGAGSSGAGGEPASSTGRPGGAAGEHCGPSTMPLKRVALHVLFDVSASMGNSMFPYYSRELKWEPVAAAFKAFFADPDAAGTFATLTFFPNELATLANGMSTISEGLECVARDYATPDVPLTALPSPLFGAAIDAVTPPDDLSWRMGTPTLPALEGVVAAIGELQNTRPELEHVVLVVTDGLPALCPGVVDAIGPVAEFAASVSETIATYVIGVDNPKTAEDPNPPDTVSALHELAAAGGTQVAFLTNTDDAAQTSADLLVSLHDIRGSITACQ